MKGLVQWRIFEDHCNELLHLSGTAASGARWHDPGDGVDHRHYSETDYALLIDAKYTEAKSHAVSAFKLRNWVQRAQEMGKRFAMPLRFRDRMGGGFEDYVLVPLNDYAELLTNYREHHGEA
jgi:hypothetical protein